MMWPKGARIDDTSMALCLGKSLLERDGYDSYNVMRKYQQWVEEVRRSRKAENDGSIRGDVAPSVGV